MPVSRKEEAGRERLAVEAGLVGAFEGNELFDAGDFEGGDVGGFQLAGDFLAQGFGEVVSAVVGDAGGAEEEFGKFGGGFPVVVLERFECGTRDPVRPPNASGFRSGFHQTTPGSFWKSVPCGETPIRSPTV